MYLYELPNEILILIFQYCDFIDLLNLRCINLKFYHLSYDNILWKTLLDQDFPQHSIQSDSNPYNIYIEEYKKIPNIQYRIKIHHLNSLKIIKLLEYLSKNKITYYTPSDFQNIQISPYNQLNHYKELMLLIDSNNPILQYIDQNDINLYQNQFDEDWMTIWI